MNLRRSKNIIMNNRNYWDKKIIDWEDSIRIGAGVSFIERLASYFRGPLKYRAETCMDILESFVKNKTVLELGCGSGFFAFELYNTSKPRHITGVDISRNAIKRAREICRDRKLADIVEFLEGDASSVALPETDITIGLGFLDYLRPKEISSLFSNMKSRYFLFTFSEKKFSFIRCIHIVYLWTQKCPKHFYYTKSEIGNYIGSKYGEVHFISNKKLSFGCIVHNLPL